MSRRLCDVLVLWLFFSGALEAKDYYFTPGGAGGRSGDSFENALLAKDLQKTFRTQAKAGDRFLLGSGRYENLPHTNNNLLVIDKGGTAEKPIIIRGVDTGGGAPVIAGKWQESKVRYHAHSSTGISIRAGASHLRIEDISIMRCMQGLSVGGSLLGVHLKGIRIETCREGMRLRDLSLSMISDCVIRRYTKRGIRFEKGCLDLVVSKVEADATAGDSEWVTESFPFGFSVEDDSKNRDLHFIECVARNNLFAGKEKDYWNGDGFVAEAKTSGLSYTRCSSFDNTDGGWDDKSLSPVFEYCVAAGNKRGFRIWNQRGSTKTPAKLTHCLGVYNQSRGGIGSSDGLWTRGAVVVENSTFHGNGTNAISLENSDPVGWVRAKNCLLSGRAPKEGKGLVNREKGTSYEAVGTGEWPGHPEDGDPQYQGAKPTWRGEPANAFQSARYPGKGYQVSPKNK